MDVIYVIFKVQFDFALEVWFSIYTLLTPCMLENLHTFCSLRIKKYLYELPNECQVLLDQLTAVFLLGQASRLYNFFHAQLS